MNMRAIENTKQMNTRAKDMSIRAVNVSMRACRNTPEYPDGSRRNRGE
jgi:hypothetical protein